MRDLNWAARRATAFWRALPDFLIIGAQRGGTTSLYRYLAATPNVRGARRKELHHFDQGTERSLADYRANFPVAIAGGRRSWVTGEATPYLLFDPRVPARVAATLPSARFVVLLRDPVDRAYSHWRRQQRHDLEDLSFEDAIAAEPARLAAVADDPSTDPYDSDAYRNSSYATRGDYISQLERWTAHVSRERILVLQSEMLFREPEATVAQVLRWLGVEAPPYGGVDYTRKGTASHDRLDGPSRRKLAQHFAPLNEQLFDFLGTRFDWTEP